MSQVQPFGTASMGDTTTVLRLAPGVFGTLAAVSPCSSLTAQMCLQYAFLY